jgi:hypothetical protein
MEILVDTLSCAFCTGSRVVEYTFPDRALEERLRRFYHRGSMIRDAVAVPSGEAVEIIQLERDCGWRLPFPKSPTSFRRSGDFGDSRMSFLPI